MTSLFCLSTIKTGKSLWLAGFLFTFAELLWRPSGGEAVHRYDGDSVLTVSCVDEDQWENVQEILSSALPMQEVDIWREPSVLRPTADIFIPHQYYDTFTAALAQQNIYYSTMISDVQNVIDKEALYNRVMKKRRKRDTIDNIVGTYPTMGEIRTWLEHIESMYSDNIELINIGRSYEGRQLTVMKISHGTNIDGSARPAIWMDSAMHAREWVSPATNIYIIHQLLTLRDTDVEIHHFLQKLDWYFLIICNPDGYEYSHTHRRLWRLNMRPAGNGNLCRGVDLNRNFDFEWGGANASPNSCSEVYRGHRPASELEVQHISRFILENQHVLQAYISLHSYTQNWFTRWSYSVEVSPHDHDHLLNLSQRAVQAIEEVHGKVYGCGKAGDLLYAYSGGSADWARGVAGIKYSFLLELRDTGVYGFLLPPEEIIPTGEETWEGIKVIVREVIDNSDPATSTSAATTPTTTPTTTTTIASTTSTTSATTTTSTSPAPTSNHHTPPAIPGVVEGDISGFDRNTVNMDSSCTNIHYTYILTVLSVLYAMCAS